MMENNWPTFFLGILREFLQQIFLRNQDPDLVSIQIGVWCVTQSSITLFYTTVHVENPSPVFSCDEFCIS
jgi:hypothetical protein